MTAAEVDFVDPDPSAARDFVSQANRFASSADKDGVDTESAVVLYWQACITAMDAVLTCAGRRVTAGTHGHSARIQECQSLLGGGYAELMERMDEWRHERGDVSYRARRSSDAIVATIGTDARDLIAAAEEFVKR